MNKEILSMDHISKHFGGVYALDDVSLNLYEGEVHVLCGENGAGKSTLMKILSGNYQEDTGTICVNGRQVVISSPEVAEQLGISIVHQELSLSPTVTVAENMFMGREFRKFGFINKRQMAENSKEFLDIVKADINPNELTGTLTVAKKQLVQIAKSLSSDARIIILDEPFSSLSEEDSENLFRVMRSLKEKGISIIYIDHRIDNFFKIGDRVTVLRDGRKICTDHIHNLTKDSIIKMMVGRDVENIYVKDSCPQNDVCFEAKGLTSNKIHDISFQVRKGEIYGLGGLVGAGRTEIVNAIFGIDKLKKGEIVLNGKSIKIRSSNDAVKQGIAYVSEDRKNKGLVQIKSVRYNASLVCLKDFSRKGFMLHGKEEETVNEYVRKLNIKTSGNGAIISSLSGGNQQKVVLAKWLIMKNLKVFLLDEPTRGIDVGAKLEIYKLINEMARAGIAIILITSELQELLALCDRISVVRNGKISGTLSRDEATQESVMKLCV